MENAQQHKFGKCYVMVSKDNGLWHMSISRKDRLPNYEEIKYARYAYLPDDIYIAQIFPPTSEFVNAHQFCLHLWELSGDVSYADDQRGSQ